MKSLNPPQLPAWLARAAREPLVHFLVLGAAIFAVDAALVALRGSDEDIVIPAEARQEAVQAFKATAGRDPAPAEMDRLLRRWLDNEILYREGVKLGLDKGDPAMRERVIFKALNVVQAGLVLPRIDEAGLRAWFEANRRRYDEPARISFDEAVVGGDAAPDSLRRFAAALNGQGTPELEASLRVFKQRPRDGVVQGYGDAFAAALEKQTPGTWAALESSGGVRAVRLQEVTPGRAVPYEEVRDAVYQDWKDDTAARLTSQAVRQLGRKYRLHGDGA